MPFSIDPMSYPPEIRQACQKVYDTGDPLTFECGEHRRAKSVKAQFYAYIRALRANAFSGKHPDRETIKDLYRVAQQITIAVTPNDSHGTQVTLTLKSSGKEMAELRRVLDDKVLPASVDLLKKKLGGK